MLTTFLTLAGTASASEASVADRAFKFVGTPFEENVFSIESTFEEIGSCMLLADDLYVKVMFEAKLTLIDESKSYEYEASVLADYSVFKEGKKIDLTFDSAPIFMHSVHLKAPEDYTG